MEWIGQLKDRAVSTALQGEQLHPSSSAPLDGSLLNFCLSLLLTSTALGFAIKTKNILHHIVLLRLIL